MKEPIKPWPPMEYQYEACIDRKYIYKFSENAIPDEDYYNDDDEDEEESEEDAKLPKKPVDKINLAWLLKQIPDGVSPKDIKIEFGVNYNCMSLEDKYLNFYYEVKVPAKKAELKAAKEKYKNDLKQYESDMVAYEAYCKAKEIKEAEEKLARLKGEQV
jgi:hypothetical protein